MRRRELQTIQLKLSELKEYEQAKLERAKARQQVHSPRTPTPTSDSDILLLPSSSVPAVLLANSTTSKIEAAAAAANSTPKHNDA
ncbi:uncharacterized protein LOC132792141 [Drosophila nasuta]|uniref:Uncharacterized protein LOC127565364 n=1 Tax=Drosophila albomicans TaxID=7291 RepID=A0A9C6SSY6_DROAB|nr:uncharacterized protein LOC127565364 [Drosophila albomicans]XP_060657407.1 uncharacterized protein LOC132792141 [Drosophila nasuta]